MKFLILLSFMIGCGKTKYAPRYCISEKYQGNKFHAVAKKESNPYFDLDFKSINSATSRCELFLNTGI